MIESIKFTCICIYCLSLVFKLTSLVMPGSISIKLFVISFILGFSILEESSARSVGQQRKIYKHRNRRPIIDGIRTRTFRGQFTSFPTVRIRGRHSSSYRPYSFINKYHKHNHKYHPHYPNGRYLIPSTDYDVEELTGTAKVSDMEEEFSQVLGEEKEESKYGDRGPDLDLIKKFVEEKRIQDEKDKSADTVPPDSEEDDKVDVMNTGSDTPSSTVPGPSETPLILASGNAQVILATGDETSSSTTAEGSMSPPTGDVSTPVQAGDAPSLPPAGNLTPLQPAGDTPPLPPAIDAPPLTPGGGVPPLSPAKDVPLLLPAGDAPPLPTAGDVPSLPPTGDTSFLPPKGNAPPFPPAGDASPLPPEGDTPLLPPAEDLPPLPAAGASPLPSATNALSPTAVSNTPPVPRSEPLLPPATDAPPSLPGENAPLPPTGDDMPLPAGDQDNYPDVDNIGQSGEATENPHLLGISDPV